MIHEAENKGTARIVMERPQIVVAADGTGDHRTITEAVAAAPSGATIKIRPGVYEEALILESPVTLLGDANGLVLIHNPNFTARNIRQTEVIMENLALGTLEGQVVMAADGIEIRMTDCVVAPSADLLNSGDTTAAGIARAHKPFAASLSRALGKDDSDSTINLKADSSLLISRSLLRAALVKATDSRVNAENSAFDDSPVTVTENAFLEISHCSFECGNLNPALSLASESNAKINDTRFHNVSGVAIRSETSQLALEDCELQGTASAPYDYERESAKGIQFISGALLTLTRTIVHGFKTGIGEVRIGAHTKAITIEECLFAKNCTGLDVIAEEAGHLRATRSRFENNSRGLNINCASLKQPSNLLSVEECEFVENSLAMWIGNWGSKNQGTVSECTFKNNRRNMAGSMLFQMECVRNCKGCGESIPFRSAQLIYGLLSKIHHWFRHAFLFWVVAIVVVTLLFSLPPLGVIALLAIGGYVVYRLCRR